MIGDLPTGAIPGVEIITTAVKGLQPMVNGRPARLAIIDDEGNIVAAGDSVGLEAEAAAVNAYRSILLGTGRLRKLPKPPEAP